MVYDIDSTTVPWPGLVIIISAGSIICTVLLLVMCSCCFKTKVPQYRAKLTKNVVAKEDIRRYTPEKGKFSERGNRMHSLIFDGAPIGCGRWDDLFVTDEEIIPNEFKRNKPNAHANPPDVIMHPALLRVLNKESKNFTQREAFIVPTSSVASPSRPSHPSSNLQELIQQSEEAEGEKPRKNDTSLAEASLAEFPIRREPSQELNRDGSILYYKPRRDVTSNDPENRLKEGVSTQVSRDQTRPGDPVTSRIQEHKQHRKSSYFEPRKSPKLPRFNRTSGEWDNVPKPGWSVDTPPPIPARNYSNEESEIASDCSETMPRPAKNKNVNQKVVEAERTKLNHISEYTPQSSGVSRQSSRSSGASSRNLPRSPESGHRRRTNVKNPSPISDTVFIPNGNPASKHGSATPPGHTPGKDYKRYPDGRINQTKDENRLGVTSDGSFEIVDESQRPNQRHKRVDDLLSDQQGQSHHHLKPGVYFRPKPYYQHLETAEKRYSDASDYSDVDDKAAQDNDPYFFRSRWSSAFETPAEVRRHAGIVSPKAVKVESPIKRLSRRSSGNGSSPDRQLRHNQRSSSQRSSRSSRIIRQEIPLPDVPFQHSSQAYHRDVSPSKRNRESRNERRTQQPLEVVIEQHKDDVLVSPGHQPNYPVDVAKIRRGLQQANTENKTKDYNQKQSDHCDRTTDQNSDICLSTTSLNVPDNENVRRASSDYGSLIDILYTYRQNVRESRVKEKPTESPESRLKFEREKLKNKLREVLEPREMQSKNVEMVVETLLYLCEAESNREKKKRSWQRDVHSDTNAAKPRSNSFKIASPTEEKDGTNYGVYDLGNYDDYARIRSNSDSRSSLVKKDKGTAENWAPQESPASMKCFKENRFQIPSDFTPRSTPSEVAEKEFAFPTVEALDRMLKQEKSPPPVPPRRHVSQSSDVIAPPVTPRKPKISRKALPPTPDEKIPNGEIINSVRHKRNPNERNGERDPPEQNEPDYAKIRKRASRKRRKSLPSRDLTESERHWLQKLGGDAAERISKNVQEFPRGNNRLVTQSVCARERSDAFSRNNDLPSPPEPPREETELMGRPVFVDDIPVDETTDAEDIIKALERKMSQNQIPLSHENADQSPSINQKSPKIHSDSEIGTWSSVTSSEIPVPPRRGRLHRSPGMSPVHDQTPSHSPVFLRKTYDTPPPTNNNRPCNPIAVAISPSRNVRNSRTPPASPQPNYSKSIAHSREFVSTSNVSLTPPLTPSPKNKAKSSSQLYTAKKQHSALNRPISPHHTPKKSPHHAGLLPNIARRSSKCLPNIPVMSRRLVQPTSQHEIVVPMESDRRRISRTGEIVYLPDDNDYAMPFDAITTGSPNRNLLPQYPNQISPISPLFHLESHSFYPIVEEDDYALPVNQTPNLLMRQRAHARSMENIANDYETAV